MPLSYLLGAGVGVILELSRHKHDLHGHESGKTDYDHNLYVVKSITCIIGFVVKIAHISLAEHNKKYLLLP